MRWRRPAGKCRALCLNQGPPITLFAQVLPRSSQAGTETPCHRARAGQLPAYSIAAVNFHALPEYAQSRTKKFGLPGAIVIARRRGGLGPIKLVLVHKHRDSSCQVTARPAFSAKSQR